MEPVSLIGGDIYSWTTYKIMMMISRLKCSTFFTWNYKNSHECLLSSLHSGIESGPADEPASLVVEASM